MCAKQEAPRIKPSQDYPYRGIPMQQFPLAPSASDLWLLIEPEDRESLAFWACLFAVSIERVTQAVAHVGGHAHDVDAFLRFQSPNCQSSDPGNHPA